MLNLRGLHIRAALFRSIREFFTSQGFLEVDTPIRQTVIIPEANIVPLMSEGSFLQTSPELCMKRLLGSGCTKIFQICPCFRKGERGRNHLEEFTMLEWYRVDADYNWLMDDCEDLLQFISSTMKAYLPPERRGSFSELIADVDVSAGWEKITVADAFQQYSPVSIETALSEKTFDELLVEYVEPHLGRNRPAFLYDYPSELASLAKLKGGEESVAERFELYISGLEMANGFSELTDSVEQRSRFLAEIALIKENSGRNLQMPDTFLEDIGHIGRAAGIAFGLDRLTMLILGENDINRAVSFSPDDA